MQNERELKIYGCPEQKIREFMESEMFQLQGTRSVLMSMLSDAQHMTFVDPEETRKLINRIKFILCEKMNKED